MNRSGLSQAGMSGISPYPTRRLGLTAVLLVFQAHSASQAFVKPVKSGDLRPVPKPRTTQKY